MKFYIELIHPPVIYIYIYIYIYNMLTGRSVAPLGSKQGQQDVLRWKPRFLLLLLPLIEQKQKKHSEECACCAGGWRYHHRPMFF